MPVRRKRRSSPLLREKNSHIIAMQEIRAILAEAGFADPETAVERIDRLVASQLGTPLVLQEYH